MEDSNQLLLNAFLIAAFATLVIVALLYFVYRNKKMLNTSNVIQNRHSDSTFAGAFQKKVEEIVSSQDGAAAAEAIAEIAFKEAQTLVAEVRQEFTTKVEKAETEAKQSMEKFEAAEKQVKKIDAEKKTTDAVVRSISDGLVVVNQKGEVLLMNPSAEKLLGAKKETKVGKSIYENNSDAMMISMSKQREGGGKTVEYSTKDENVKKVIRSSSAVIQNEDGQTIGMVNILTDVTKQKELDEIKNQFISNVTHELRTPIVAMQKALLILQNPSAGPLNDTQSNFLSIVTRNLTNLSQLVEDVLDISKIDAGKLTLKIEPNSVTKVLNNGCDLLETWAKSKNVSIDRDIPQLPDAPLDPAKINQVLNNLLSNAIKFTAAGGKITVSAAQKDDVIEIRVRDTGVGMAPENLSKLFKRFEQFGDQVGIQGTGLGLNITKEIIEAHGGQIRAESDFGKGSTFIFTLPLKPVVKEAV